MTEQKGAILSIQSQVAYGHVGNRAAVFPLERLGFEVWPIGTVQFSNHTGYGAWAGDIFPASHVAAVWEGVRGLGVASGCAAVLSGYLGDAAIGEAILRAVAEVKAANPGALYCCDPVMGDYGKGFYVREAIPAFIRDRALARADIVVPNQFEAEFLSGGAIAGIDDARRAAAKIHAAGPAVVLVTSFKPRGSEPGMISLFLSDSEADWILETPELRLDPAPNGAGDLTAAIFLGRYLESGDARSALEAMADSVFSVFERTLREGSRELMVVASQEAIARPRGRFAARRA